MKEFTELKHNFLTQVTIRCDYNGLLDSDLEAVCMRVRGDLNAKGFDRGEARWINPTDMQIRANLNLPLEENVSFNGMPTGRVFRFVNSTTLSFVEISKTFFILSINTTDNNPVSEFNMLTSTILEHIKGISPYYNGYRISLKKVNICLINDIDRINCYFKKSAFNVNDTLQDVAQGTFCRSNNFTMVDLGPFKINYVRDLLKGSVIGVNRSQEETNQAVIDIEAFCDGHTFAGLSNKDITKMLGDMDDSTFCFFCSSLESAFLAQLQEERYICDGIISGVK